VETSRKGAQSEQCTLPPTRYHVAVLHTGGGRWGNILNKDSPGHFEVKVEKDAPHRLPSHQLSDTKSGKANTAELKQASKNSKEKEGASGRREFLARLAAGRGNAGRRCTVLECRAGGGGGTWQKGLSPKPERCREAYSEPLGQHARRLSERGRKPPRDGKRRTFANGEGVQYCY